MAKAELKTKRTSQSVTEFVNGLEGQQKKDSKAIIKMMRAASGSKPVMWGDSIVGFGHKHLVYKSGRELEWFLTGFSPRKGKMSVYCMCRNKKFDTLLQKLGKHKSGKGCLYINKLDDVDAEVLSKLIEISVQETRQLKDGAL